MAVIEDNVAVAKAAGLLYVNDEMPCIRRRRCGKGWQFIGPDGTTISDPTEKQRIMALAIPPAWKDVWICPNPRGHILATGRDDKGRKQYRYHDRWREVRDETKFHKMAQFGQMLPGMRKEVDGLLRQPGLPKEKVLALVVRLLDDTLIRIGNDEYAETNDAYGLTTLKPEHVEVNGSVVEFEFTGKSGIDRELAVHDRDLARLVKQCHELGGQELFAYRGRDGEPVDIGSTDVNAFLRDLSGGDDVTAKDFRTWGGTVEAARALAEMGEPDDEKDAKRKVLAAIDRAAERLGNTRAVARSAYVHPAVPESYEDGVLLERWRKARTAGTLDRGERTVLSVLQDHLE